MIPTLSDLYRAPRPAAGPLRRHPGNKRYFGTSDDAAAPPVYLIGSHTWANFQDIGFEGDPPFDYERYLAFMRAHGMNFMRLWSWEHAAWATWSAEKVIFGPSAYLRTGPGLALDGRPKFDLTQFNQVYFDRMRARLIQARDNGIYAAVMLFQAFSYDWVWHYGGAHNNLGHPFNGHPYHAQNNIQGLDGDKDNDRRLDIDDPAVRAWQAAYIRKVVETVNDLDNVLYEVINEGGNPDWNEFVMGTVRACERALPKRHLIGLTGHAGISMPQMEASSADWLAPGFHDLKPFYNAMTDPRALGDDEPKLSVLDTDHMWGHGMDYKWVWRSFLRGHHVLFMDPWGPLAGWYDPVRNSPDFPGYEEGRLAMHNVAVLAQRLPLLTMRPLPELASTRFCLAQPGQAYLAYLPEGGRVTLDLSAATEALTVTWIDPIQGKLIAARPIAVGEALAEHALQAPFSNDAVLYVATQGRALS